MNDVILTLFLPNQTGIIESRGFIDLKGVSLLLDYLLADNNGSNSTSSTNSNNSKSSTGNLLPASLLSLGTTISNTINSSNSSNGNSASDGNSVTSTITSGGGEEKETEEEQRKSRKYQLKVKSASALAFYSFPLEYTLGK